MMDSSFLALDAAKIPESRSPCLFGRQTVRHSRLDLAIDVIAQLGISVALQA
jgi:hypothetical protein